MPRINKKQIRTVILFGIVSILIFYLSMTGVQIWTYGNRDEKRPSDVAIVLGAATSNGEVSPVYRERINHGIWLYSNGYVDFLIFTGGVGKGNSVSDAFSAKQYAVAQGVPETAILIEEKSAITEENLKYAKEIMEKNSFQTAVIVSDPLHMKRAMLMAKDYGIDACSSPTSTSKYQTLKTQIPFFAAGGIFLYRILYSANFQVRRRLMVRNYIFDFGNVLARFYPEELTSACVDDPTSVKIISEVVFDRIYWDRLDAGTISDEEVNIGFRSRLPQNLYGTACTVYDCWIENLTPVNGMSELVSDLKNSGGKLYLLSNISISFSETYHKIA